MVAKELTWTYRRVAMFDVINWRGLICQNLKIWIILLCSDFACFIKYDCWLQICVPRINYFRSNQASLQHTEPVKLQQNVLTMPEVETATAEPVN